MEVKISFWMGFNEAWEKDKDRKLKETLLDKQLLERRRDNLLALTGDVFKRRQEASTKGKDYTNSVRALADRLRDENGDLIPGADTLLNDPAVAHTTLNKIKEVEQEAAKNDNAYVPPMRGEVLLENFTAYSSGGQRVAVPEVDVDSLVQSIMSDEEITREDYEQYYMDLNRAVPNTVEPPEPVVEMNPELLRKPDVATYKAGREAYVATLSTMLAQDIASLTGVDDAEAQNKYTDLVKIQESLKKDGEKSPYMSQLNDLYGAQAYGVLKKLAESDPTIQRIESDALLSGARSSYYITQLRKIINTDGVSEEKKEYARRQLKQRFGVEP